MRCASTHCLCRPGAFRHGDAQQFGDHREWKAQVRGGGRWLPVRRIRPFSLFVFRLPPGGWLVCVAQRALVLLLGLIIGLARRPLPIGLLCRLEAINGQNVHARHV